MLYDHALSLVSLSVLRPESFAKDLPALVILLAFAALLTLEVRVGLRGRLSSVQRQSYQTNLYTVIFNNLLMSALSVTSLLALADHYGRHGLLAGLDSPWAKGAVSFILFDFMLFLWHKANHQFEWLWMFHKVHHSDRAMNVSTAFRLHFVELLLTTLLKALFIVVMGVEVAVVAVTEAIMTVFVMFHHTNIAFRAERWLSRVIVVPSLHRVHHSALRSEHDSNYGAVLSLWDRLFRTYVELRPKEIGLRNVPGQSFLELLQFGLMPPAAVPRPVPANTDNSFAVREMIEKAAYYRAEKRGFAPGWEWLDWFEAEREISDRVGHS